MAGGWWHGAATVAGLSPLLVCGCGAESPGGSPAVADASAPDAGGDGAAVVDAPVVTTDAMPEGGTGPGAMTWFVGADALGLLSAVDGGAGLVAAYFSVPSTYVFVSSGTASSAPAGSSPAMTFTAVHTSATACGDAGPPTVTGLTEAVEAGLPASVRAVLYDNEGWCFTPLAEKDSTAAFATSETSAAAAAHQAGLTMLAAPAQDIVHDLPGEADASVDDRYLGLMLPALAAAHADVFEIQSQGLQPDQASFVSFVSAAASQARAANPDVRVLAGLSTNPSDGNIPSSYELCQLVMATRGTVQGYWLNVPKQGDPCPSCSTDPHADVGVDLLRQLAAGACDPSVQP